MRLGVIVPLGATEPREGDGSPPTSSALLPVPSDHTLPLPWPPGSYPATMVTTFCSPEYHGNRIPLPTVLWQPLSTTHNTRAATFC